MRFGECSLNEKWLLNFMWSINFGEVNNLVVSNGRPLKKPKPHFLKTNKLGKKFAKDIVFSDDFELSCEQKALIEYIHHINDGIIPKITVSNGIPIDCMIEMEDCNII